MRRKSEELECRCSSSNFIEKNNIYLGVENGKIIFTHNFVTHDFWEGDIYGGYALYYIEDDDNADEKGFKLKDNFYYDEYYGE